MDRKLHGPKPPIEAHLNQVEVAAQQLDQLLSVNLNSVICNSNGVLDHYNALKNAYIHYNSICNDARAHLQSQGKMAQREDLRVDRIEKYTLVAEVKNDLNNYAEALGFEYLSSISDNSSVKSGFSLGSQLSNQIDVQNNARALFGRGKHLPSPIAQKQSEVQQEVQFVHDKTVNPYRSCDIADNVANVDSHSMLCSKNDNVNNSVDAHGRLYFNNDQVDRRSDVTDNFTDVDSHSMTYSSSDHENNCVDSLQVGISGIAINNVICDSSVLSGNVSTKGHINSYKKMVLVVSAKLSPHFSRKQL